MQSDWDITNKENVMRKNAAVVGVAAACLALAAGPAVCGVIG